MQKVETNDAPKAKGLLSQGIGSGGFVFTAGQVHCTPDGALADGSVADKTHLVIKNCEAVLKAASLGLDNVIKVNIYVTDISFGAEFNEVYKIYFKDEPLPVREMICVKSLPLGADIEVSMIAEKK